MQINSDVLYWIFSGIKNGKSTKEDCVKMIAYVKDAIKSPLSKGEKKYYESVFIDSIEFDNIYKHKPIHDACISIRDNYLSNKSTHNYIINEYVYEKLAKGKNIPSVIKIPKALRILLTKEDLETIIDTWRSKYGRFTKFKIH